MIDRRAKGWVGGGGTLAGDASTIAGIEGELASYRTATEQVLRKVAARV